VQATEKNPEVIIVRKQSSQIFWVSWISWQGT